VYENAIVKYLSAKSIHSGFVGQVLHLSHYSFRQFLNFSTASNHLARIPGSTAFGAFLLEPVEAHPPFDKLRANGLHGRINAALLAPGH